MEECNTDSFNKTADVVSSVWGLSKSRGGKSRRISRRSRKRRGGMDFGALKSAAALFISRLVCAIIGPGPAAAAERAAAAAAAAARETVAAAERAAAPGTGSTFATRALASAKKAKEAVAEAAKAHLPINILSAVVANQAEVSETRLREAIIRQNVIDGIFTPEQRKEALASWESGGDVLKKYITKLLFAIGIADIMRDQSLLTSVLKSLLEFFTSIASSPVDITAGIGNAMTNIGTVGGAAVPLAAIIVTAALSGATGAFICDVIGWIQGKLPDVSIPGARLNPAELDEISEGLVNRIQYTATGVSQAVTVVVKKAGVVAQKASAAIESGKETALRELTKRRNKSPCIRGAAAPEAKVTEAAETADAAIVAALDDSKVAGPLVVGLLADAFSGGADAADAAAASAARPAARPAAAATGPGVAFSPEAYANMLKNRGESDVKDGEPEDEDLDMTASAAAVSGQNPLLIVPSGIAAPAAADAMQVDGPVPGGLGPGKRGREGPSAEGPAPKRRDTTDTGGRRTRRLRRRANRKRAFTRRH